MKFYTSIVSYYDEVFPYQAPQKAFVESFNVHDYNAALLDVGCGTGSLVLNLADRFGTLIGIDPDKEMLHLAQLKALKFKADHRDSLEELGHWVFKQGGMLDISNEFASQTFSTVLCLGNTLVHLSSPEEVRSFLEGAFEILRPGGLLMIQIINYDRIINQELKGLPTIENEKVRFERVYHYDSSPGFISFQTKLTIKESGEEIENEIPLLGLRPNQLKTLMLESGFSGLEEFGNFKKDAFGPDSQPYILVGRK